MSDEESENQLEKGGQSLATLLNSLPGMAYRSLNDRSRTLEYASEGCFDLTGYPPEVFVSNRKMGFAELIHPLDRELVWGRVQAAAAAGKPFNVTYRIRTASGKEKWVRELGRAIFSQSEQAATLEGFVSDVSDRKESERRIQRQVLRFEALRKIDIAITASLDQRVTLDILLDQVTTHLGVDAADVLIYNPSNRLLEYAAGRGFLTTALQHTRLRLGMGYAGIAALERRIIHIPALSEELGELGRAAHIQEEGFSSYFCVPLIAKGQVKGILELFHRSAMQPDAEWSDFLEALAGQAAIAIDNATLFNELQRSNLELSLAYDATLEGWTRAQELREQETPRHSQEVVDLTLRLSQVLRVTAIDPIHIRRGALLHDIGKIAIPDHILLKPGPLTEEEWQIMRQHPVYAYQLLSPIANLRPALDIPYCHHEKWDGSGYPRGLKGENIPYVARIFAVADVWKALLQDRAYRRAWPEEKAYTYILEQSGSHFDPEIVRAFLDVYAEERSLKGGYRH
jgi:PAS domain S-box-containing protein